MDYEPDYDVYNEAPPEEEDADETEPCHHPGCTRPVTVGQLPEYCGEHVALYYAPLAWNDHTDTIPF